MNKYLLALAGAFPTNAFSVFVFDSIRNAALVMGPLPLLV